MQLGLFQHRVNFLNCIELHIENAVSLISWFANLVL